MNVTDKGIKNIVDSQPTRPISRFYSATEVRSCLLTIPKSIAFNNYTSNSQIDK